MKVLLLSGFLGAGKTTFIQNLSDHLKDFCILENDYAMADVDSNILKSTNRDVFSLDDGCICCSKGADFATTVVTISTQINPPYLIIEPTGLGYLSKIIENIKPIEYEKIEILSPITIVDFHKFEQTKRDYESLFLDGIKNAGHILFSKIENISSHYVEEARDKLSSLTDAKIYTKHYSTFTDEMWQDLLVPFSKNVIGSGSTHTHMQTIVRENPVFSDFQELGTALSAISQDRFGKLVRAKGHVKVKDHIAKVDVVSGSFDIKPDDENSGKMVFVGENLDKRAFEILFKEK